MYLKEYLEKENLEIFHYNTENGYKIQFGYIIKYGDGMFGNIFSIIYSYEGDISIENCLEKLGNKIVKQNENINNIEISDEFIFQVAVICI